MTSPAPGDSVIVLMPGFCIDGRHGTWSGAYKPPQGRGRWTLPEGYEILLHSGDLDSVWLPMSKLRWLDDPVPE